jgi:hypothetical protein
LNKWSLWSAKQELEDQKFPERTDDDDDDDDDDDEDDDTTFTSNTLESQFTTYFKQQNYYNDLKIA